MKATATIANPMLSRIDNDDDYVYFMLNPAINMTTFVYRLSSGILGEVPSASCCIEVHDIHRRRRRRRLVGLLDDGL